MSCNNYTATQIPLSVGFDANGNAGSLVETKEIKVTKIETPTDADQLIIAAGTEVVFEGDVVVQGYLYGVAAEGASSLSSLTDVAITSVANGEVLVWSSNDWINRTLSEAGILGTTDLANYATNTYVSSNYATSNSLSAYAPSSWVNSNFLANSTIGTTVQGWDVALDALSLVTPAADRLPYFTGGSTAATATLTSFARNNILAATNGATVVAAINAQTYDLNLQNIVDIGQPGIGFDTWVIAWSEGNSQFELQPQTGGVGSLDLNSLTDVNITAAANNEFLIYDTGVNQWVDKTPAQARSALGANTLGSNIITATNNGTGQDTYLRVNFDNTVEVRTYAQVKDDLDVVPGTNVQAYDAGLQSIANLNPGANTLVYFSSTDGAASSPLTQFGRSLLDDANATECRGTLSAQVSALSLNNIKDICAATGPSAFGRLLYTVPDGVIGGVNIFPVPLFDPATIANNYGKVLSLRDPGGGVYAQPQFQFLYFGELGNVNLGGGAGQGGNLTSGSILYVDASQNLTELAKPVSDSFLKHNGTTPSWRSAADVRTDIGAQASDPTLTALAGVTTANNTIIYFNGVDSATSTGLTAAGRKIIACPDTLAAGDFLYYDGTDIVKLAAPASISVLVYTPTADPPFEWVATTDGGGNKLLRFNDSTNVIEWVNESNYAN